MVAGLLVRVARVELHVGFFSCMHSFLADRFSISLFVWGRTFWSVGEFVISVGYSLLPVLCGVGSPRAGLFLWSLYHSGKDLSYVLNGIATPSLFVLQVMAGQPKSSSLMIASKWGS
ncbi:hypothetical protein SUGI_1126350 [Cryptomeria japonica]|nr:hypothetical protein SUGI_1126350 [Cryptomeria japonica]